MKRVSLGLLALCWITIANHAAAEQSNRIPVVGFLITHPPITDKVVHDVRNGLLRYGYEDGRNIRLEVRTAMGDLDRVPDLAEELVQFPSDVIILVNEPALLAVRRATNRIPIVTIGNTDDPVKKGWIESYRRPGGNITGIYNVDSALRGKRLEILKETLPEISRVAVFWDPAFSTRQMDELQQAAKLLQVQLEPIKVLGPDDFASAFRAVAENNADALMLMWSPLFYVHRVRIAQLAVQAKLPSVCSLDEAVKAGCLLSYGSDGTSTFERTGYYVDRLLNGARAADLPVEQVSKLILAVNLATANTLGIVIPRSILLRADEVIH